MSESGACPGEVTDHASALESICRENWAGIYSFVYWRVQNRQEAEDIVQEAFARFLSTAGRFTPDDSGAGGLLRVIALNLIRDGWRRRAVRGPHIPLEAVPEPPALDESQRSVERLAVRSALGQLPDDQRAAVELRLVEGFSVRETARALGKSEVAIRSLQYRGLRNLARLLAGSENRGRDGR